MSTASVETKGRPCAIIGGRVHAARIKMTSKGFILSNLTYNETIELFPKDFIEQ